MAIMIPSEMTEFSPDSGEDLMFEALKKLPDDYYVFYSFRTDDLITDEDGFKTLKEHEIDFIIYHPDKGLMFIEAKNGAKITRKYGDWFYSGGKQMDHGGPFEQARSNMYRMERIINSRLGKDYKNLCNFIFAVWFPKMSKYDISKIPFSPGEPKELVLTVETLNNPKDDIDRIFSIKLNSNKPRQGLTDSESNDLINKVLCPHVEVFQTQLAKDIESKHKFSRMLKEQSNILNFLEDQKYVVISGVAGTGKTVIALEKAKRCAEENSRVLFLCYNTMLKKEIERNYAHPFIKYYTLNGYARELTGSDNDVDFYHACDCLREQISDGSFPYTHVIIDEGQDIGRLKVDSTSFLEELRKGTELNDGTLYIFYDKLQMIQANKLSDFIKDADSKVTLYKNCRNTYNIATTSMKPLNVKKPILKEGTIHGSRPNIHFCNPREIKSRVDKILINLKQEGCDRIVILTCSTLENSVLSTYTDKNKFKYNEKAEIYTPRIFKGLEADGIILVDVEKKHFMKRSRNEVKELFYVGASRARLKLEIVTAFSEADCKEIIMQNHPDYVVKNYRKELADQLNAEAKINYEVKKALSK